MEIPAITQSSFVRIPQWRLLKLLLKSEIWVSQDVSFRGIVLLIFHWSLISIVLYLLWFRVIVHWLMRGRKLLLLLQMMRCSFGLIFLMMLLLLAGGWIRLRRISMELWLKEIRVHKMMRRRRIISFFRMAIGMSTVFFITAFTLIQRYRNWIRVSCILHGSRIVIWMVHYIQWVQIRNASVRQYLLFLRFLRLLCGWLYSLVW